MTEMSEKQAAYRQALIERGTPSLSTGAGQRAQALMCAALALSLPVPADSRECSAQIDALGAADLRALATALGRDAARALAQRIADRVGPTGERIPAAGPEGWAWTPATWRAYVQSVLA